MTTITSTTAVAHTENSSMNVVIEGVDKENFDICNEFDNNLRGQSTADCLSIKQKNWKKRMADIPISQDACLTKQQKRIPLQEQYQQCGSGPSNASVTTPIVSIEELSDDGSSLNDNKTPKKSPTSTCDLLELAASIASPSSPGDSFALANDEPNNQDDENENENETNYFMEKVSNLIEIRGICHINLVEAQFLISHNEETNDFFLDLVQSNDNNQCVLQVIFRFPEKRNGTVEIFTSSYGKWRTPGRVVYYDDLPSDCSGSNCICCSNNNMNTNDKATINNPQRLSNEEVPSATEQPNTISDQQRKQSCDDNNCENNYDSNNCDDQQERRSMLNCRQPQQQHHWHLQLHVYESCYTIQLNGRLIDRFAHRFAFEKIQKKI